MPRPRPIKSGGCWFPAAACGICDNVLTIRVPWMVMPVREPEAVAQARYALGAELAAYRRAARCTQAALAKLTGYSRSTIANVETGRQHVPRDLWERADTALRTGGVLATGHDEVEAATRRALRTAARDASTARKTGAIGNGLLGVPGGEPSPPPTPGGLPGELRDVARLRSMRQQLKSIDNAHGGGTALPMVMGYVQKEVPPIMNGCRHPASPSLAVVVAELYCDVGWAAYDAGQQALATKYLKKALRFAHAAGDRMLGARIQAALSHQAIYLGRVRQAVDFAEAARAAAQRLATPRTVAMLATMEACAHAAAGDSRRSQQALADAASALTSMGRGEPEPEWLDFDEGGYWGHAARAYRDLGQLDKAERYAAKAVGLCLAGHSRTRAQRAAIQATAYLRMGEVGAAAAAGLQVVNDAWNLRSGHVLGEITQLAEAITPFRTPEAAEFLNQARELLMAQAPALTQPGPPS
jgi:tetratricopeptide (TPR) repeat protein